MDLRVISRFLGKIALAEGGVLFLPLAMAIIMGESSWLPFVGSIILCGLVGMSCLNYGRVRTQKLTMREGIAITGIGWMLATFLGMLPYCLGGYLSYFDGLFESVSGFTGTGATVITDLEILPQSLLLWRSMTHWLGGSGLSSYSSPSCPKPVSRRCFTCIMPNRQGRQGNASCPGFTT